MVMQAVVPSRRIEEIIVVLCQRPRSRVMLVFAPLSSRKTSRHGSIPP